MAFKSIFATTKKKEEAPKTKGFKRLFDIEEVGAPPQPPKKPSETVTLPEHLEGGVFKRQFTDKDKIEARDISDQTKEAIRDGTYQDTLAEVNHIISVSLGGTKDRENLEPLKNDLNFQGKIKRLFGTTIDSDDLKNRQGGRVKVEQQVARDVKAGKISREEGIVQIKGFDFLQEAMDEISVGQRTAKSIFQFGQKTFNKVANALSNTKFFRESGAALEAIERGEVPAEPSDFLVEEIGTGLSEFSKSFSGRGTAALIDTFLASPINWTTRAMYGESNAVGDFFSGFADEMRETFTTEESQRISAIPFSIEKVKDPAFWTTTIAEHIPVTLGFMKVAQTPFNLTRNATKALLGTSKFANIASTVAASVVGGSTMRAFESASEAEETYKNAKELGQSEARAVEAGKEVFMDNLKLVGLDAIQIAIALSPVKFKGGSILIKILKETAKLATAAGTEAFEELFQFRAQEEALTEGDISLLEALKDPRGQESTFIGGVMGVAFQAGGQISTAQANRAETQFMNNVAEFLPSNLKERYDGATTLEEKRTTMEQLSEEFPSLVQNATQQYESSHGSVVENTKQAIQQIKFEVSKVKASEKGFIQIPSIKPEDADVGDVLKQDFAKSRIEDVAKKVNMRVADKIAIEIDAAKTIAEIDPANISLENFVETIVGQFDETEANLDIIRASAEETLASIQTQTSEDRAMFFEKRKPEKGRKFLAELEKDIAKKISKKVPITKEKLKQEVKTTRVKQKGEAQIERQTRRAELKSLRTVIQERFKAIERGIQQGRTFTKAEIKSNQEEIINLLNESQLEASDKAKFISTIKNIQTAGQFIREFANIEERIEELETKAERRTLKTQIEKELKGAKVKKVDGKPVGKFTPEIQDVLDSMISALKLNQTQADEKIIANIDKFPETPPPEVAMENFILSTLHGDATVDQLAVALDIIQEMKETGKIARELQKFNIEGELATERTFVIDRVTGKKGIKKGKETFGERQTRRTELINTMKTLGKRWVLDWQGQLETLDFNMPVDDKALAKKFSNIKQDNLYKQFELNFQNDFKDAISKAYNIEKKATVIHKQLMKLGEEINLGTFKNTEGIESELILTKDEMIKRWMEFQDISLAESFETGNKFTNEITDAINAKMTEQDKVFANEQFIIYKKQWEKINPIYSSIYGVNLPFNEFYSPIRRTGFKVDELQGMGEFIVESTDRIALTSSALKSRVKNLLAIEQQSSIETLSRHIKETNYFIAWADQMRRLRQVYGNPNVKDAIKQEFGTQMNVAIGNTLDDLTTNGNRRARRYAPVDYFRKNFTIGALAIKPVIGIKQLVSTVAYLEKVNPIEFSAGVIDFWKAPIKNYKILVNESILIETRGEQGNIERDIKAAQASDIFKKFGKKQSFIDMMMLNVKIGDKGAIVVGSWAMRKARLKQGVPIVDIIREYEEFSASTQQSADISRLSEVQRGGSLDQLFTMFKSSPRQYYQKELLAVKTLFQKDGFTPKNLKKVGRVLAIYHIMIPVLFQYIANFGGWDEDDKKDYLRAAILGSLNGLFIAGDIIDGILRAVLGLRVWDVEVAPFEIRNTIIKGVNKLDFEDVTAEDMFAALSEWSEAGNFVGVPVVQTKQFISGMKDIIDGSIQRGIAQLLGWSTFFIDDDKGKLKLPKGAGLPKLPKLPKPPALPKL